MTLLRISITISTQQWTIVTTSHLTRNEQESGSSPLVGSLYLAYLSRIVGYGAGLNGGRGTFYITRTSPRVWEEWDAYQREIGLQKTQYELDFVESNVGETLRCSFTCSGISDCPRGCATRMAQTTSRSTSHHRKTLLIARQGPAAPTAEGLTSDGIDSLNVAAATAGACYALQRC